VARDSVSISVVMQRHATQRAAVMEIQLSLLLLYFGQINDDDDNDDDDDQGSRLQYILN